MKPSILPQDEKYIKNRRFHSRWQRAALILAAVVAFCTTYALILPAVTMESSCQIPEHTHGDDCYMQVVPMRKSLICTPETLNIHKHTADCKNAAGELVCGYADFVVHVHDAACYDEDGRLWCPLPEIKEHHHTASCYAPVKTHTHSESCYAQERGELICTQHEHTPDCWADTEVLVCGLEESSGHQHDESCLTVTESLVCGLEESEGHHHSADCWAQHTEITCGLEESSGHQHSEACYQQSRELICGIESDHQHTDECYSMIDVLICGEEETPEANDAEPICGKKEAILHRHTQSCRNGNGALICGQLEVLAHQHGDDCFAEVEDSEEVSTLACTNTDENHVHTARCYGTWVLVCGLTEHTHTDACYTSAGDAAPTAEPSGDEDNADDVPTDPTEEPAATAEPKEPAATAEPEEPAATAEPESPSATAEPESPSATVEPEGPSDDAEPEEPSETVEPDNAAYAAAGTLNVALLYGDELPQSSHPDGVFYYTHVTMSGYLRLEPNELENDLSDVTVTLSIPKRYVEKDSVKIPEFNTNSSATQYEILPVDEDDENYYARIHFTTYDKTQTLELPFLLSFADDVTPDNYVLPVTASVSGGDATAPNLYKPQYKDWNIEKFVNSNRYKEFAQDGAEVVVTPKEENGNPYLDDLTYVDFAFIVNGCTYKDADLHDWRDACEVTLTDLLPKYTDRDGKEQIAVFDADKNPGWTLSEDGTSVSRTYTGARSGDVLTQIYNGALHLRFPGLKFETKDGDLIADLDNSVQLTAVPSNAAEGETHPEADDSLRFRMTNDPSTAGRFSKWAFEGDIYDMTVYKTNPYPWRIDLTNEKQRPLQHIVIQDRKITENGQTVLGGLDEALKFVRLESDGHSTLASGQTFADIIDRVVAYYTDGTTQDYAITQDMLNANGHFSIVFDESKVCDGYEIVFRDDYAMQHGEKTAFVVYTVYRDPEHTYVPAGQEKVTYTNEARSVNSYQNGDETVFVYLKQTGHYDMLPSTEKLTVGKLTLVNDSSSKWDGIGGNTVGSTYAYVIQLRGSLLPPELKTYEDLRIVDLLPDGVHYEKIHLIQQNSLGDLTGGSSVLDGGKSYQPEIIENYHNSGRTALIFHLNAENLEKLLSAPQSGADIYFGVTIDQDAHPGTIRNYAYVVGDNLEEYREKTGGVEDVYDLNNNGRTDDQIAGTFSDATIVAAQSIYAEKFIAPAGSDSWSKQGLLVREGESFDYLLKITNETGAEYHGLTLYDVLPHAGDQNIFAQSQRGSEFPVALRGPITPPAGYTVLYTTSADVYHKSMHAMLSEEVWTSSVSDYAAVTAFQIRADEDTVLEKSSVFQVRIPVKAPDALDEASMKLLPDKTEQDQSSGTITWLESINSFGFRTQEAADEKESNAVWARIPFAGFCVKKIDGESGAALSGAEFVLADEEGHEIARVVSGEDGLVSFRDLTEGVYTLTETRVPDGYMDQKLSIAVTIKQNPATMAFNISFDGAYTGTGSRADPILVGNYTTPVLPETGGCGLSVVYALGGLLILSAAALWISGRRGKGARASE